MTVTIRDAAPADVPEILRLVHALAVYEKEPDAVEATEADFTAALFPESGTPTTRCLIAEVEGTIIGMAVWYVTFSTWTGRNGIWLEDARGNYKIVAKLLKMELSDYKRFLNFLRKHDCQLPFQEYRQ